MVVSTSPKGKKAYTTVMKMYQHVVYVAEMPHPAVPDLTQHEMLNLIALYRGQLFTYKFEIAVSGSEKNSVLERTSQMTECVIGVILSI